MFFLISLGIISVALADEILTTDGERYEGIIIDQSPSDITIRLKDKAVRVDRSNVTYIKKWAKEKNEALTEGWAVSDEQKISNLKAKEAELKYADSVRFSSEPWEIYEEDAFIAFHHQEGIVRSRLEGKVANYCRKVADKLGYREFKLYDKTTSPDWKLKFKFYSYRTFNSWKDALSARGIIDVSNVAAFAAGNRRVFFYELYMKEDVIYHEISHEIYDEFIKNARTPRWWSEGIAQYTLLTTQEAREDISKSRFRALTDKQISLSGRDYSIEHIYEDGLSLIYFLVRDKGKEKFQEFNYNLRQNRQFDKVLFEVYGFENINALEKAWVEYLKKIDVEDIVGQKE